MVHLDLWIVMIQIISAMDQVHTYVHILCVCVAYEVPLHIIKSLYILYGWKFSNMKILLMQYCEVYVMKNECELIMS